LERAKNPLLRAHAFGKVIPKLNTPDILPPALLKQFLGNTRIVLFRRTATPSVLEGDAKSRRLEGRTEKDLLHALSTFRFGFTQQMASLVWGEFGVTGSRVRQYLKAFVARDLIRYAVGEYHVPQHAKWPTGNLTASDVDVAKRHYSAGIAFAPYLATVDVPALAFDRAFVPENIHEAQYHLRTAFDNLDKDPRNAFRATVDTALKRLLRFAEYPGWNIVKRLSYGQVTQDGYDVAMDLLEDRRRSDTPPHPEHFHMVIGVVEKHWLARRGQEDEHDLLREMAELFEDSLKACDNPLWHGERPYNLLRILAQRCIFLLKNEAYLPQPRSHGEAIGLIGRARNLLDPESDGEPKAHGSAATGEWYEAVGDTLQSHQEAQEWYKRGICWAPEWHQLWVKYCGCYSLTGLDDADGQVIVNTITCEKVDVILYHSRPALGRDKKRQQRKTWVKDRWSAGVKQLQNRFGCEPSLQKYSQQYKVDLANWTP
jgi:hypothetical protein